MSVIFPQSASVLFRQTLGAWYNGTNAPGSGSQGQLTYDNMDNNWFVLQKTDQDIINLSKGAAYTGSLNTFTEAQTFLDNVGITGSLQANWAIFNGQVVSNYPGVGFNGTASWAINTVGGGSGGNQNLQDVTTLGGTTSASVTFTGPLTSSQGLWGTASWALNAVSNDGIQSLQDVTTIGNQTSASINITGSLTNGSDPVAIGLYSHAEGIQTTTIGANSHTEGALTTAIGNISHAEGNATIAIGVSSHAEGVQTTTVGANSHAEGSDTRTIGLYSHAEGSLTEAIGDQSHAEGGNTTSIGASAHSEGSYTTAKSNDSHAEGVGTISSAVGQHVQGTWNIEDTTALWVVGNGSNDFDRRNLIVATGSILQVTGSFNVTSSTSDVIKISGLGNYANDTVAAAAGVPIDGIYRNGNVISIRIS